MLVIFGNCGPLREAGKTGLFALWFVDNSQRRLMMQCCGLSFKYAALLRVGY
jgi:hypothetical protein